MSVSLLAVVLEVALLICCEDTEVAQANLAGTITNKNNEAMIDSAMLVVNLLNKLLIRFLIFMLFLIRNYTINVRNRRAGSNTLATDC